MCVWGGTPYSLQDLSLTPSPHPLPEMEVLGLTTGLPGNSQIELFWGEWIFALQTSGMWLLLFVLLLNFPIPYHRVGQWSKLNQSTLSSEAFKLDTVKEMKLCFGFEPTEVILISTAMRKGNSEYPWADKKKPQSIFSAQRFVNSFVMWIRKFNCLRQESLTRY